MEEESDYDKEQSLRVFTKAVWRHWENVGTAVFGCTALVFASVWGWPVTGTLFGLLAAGCFFSACYRPWRDQKRLADEAIAALLEIKNAQIELKPDFVFDNPPDLGRIDVFRLRLSNNSMKLALGVKVVLEEITSDSQSFSNVVLWPLSLPFVPPLYLVGEYSPSFERDINPHDHERFEIASYFVDKPNYKFIGLPPLNSKSMTTSFPGLVI